MSRRSGASLQVLLATAVVGLFVYGLYSHHDVQTRLKKSDEKGERLRQQHDSLSAQLQVVYEHKTRLEKSLQQEKADHRKTRTDLLQQHSDAQTKYENEKQELLNRVNSINQEYRMMKSQHEDLQMELTKLTEGKAKLEEDHKKLSDQHTLEYQQMQQEKINEIANLRDQLANLQRKNEDMENRLAVAVQNYQLNQDQLQHAVSQVAEIRHMNSELKAEISRQKMLLQQQNQHAQQQGNQQQGNQQQGNQQQGNQHQQQPPEQPIDGAIQQQQKQQQQIDAGLNNGQQLNNFPADQQGRANVLNRQIPQSVQSQFNNNNNNNNNGVVDMAIRHKNPELDPQQKVNEARLRQEAYQQQQQQFDQHHQQQGQGQQQNSQNQLQAGDQGQKEDHGQGQDGGQDQAMQIRLPGAHEHPGYHEVKKPDPGPEGQPQLGHGHADDSQGEGHAAPAVADAEHKDVQFQQVAAPNMSPEKKEDQDKAMEEHDTVDEEKAAIKEQLDVPQVRHEGFNQANPLVEHQEGMMGGAQRNVIQAPENPDHAHGGAGVDQDRVQMERPNVVPPMVNNQEDQVPIPKAPQLHNNEILQHGQQVNDDDDYDNGRNNG